MPRAELSGPGMDDERVNATVLQFVCSACDLLRSFPAFRSGPQGCPMTAVLQLYERSRTMPAFAKPGDHALPLMALQLLRCVFAEEARALLLPLRPTPPAWTAAAVLICCMHGSACMHPGLLRCS
jgi:hypothetical protein